MSTATRTIATSSSSGLRELSGTTTDRFCGRFGKPLGGSAAERARQTALLEFSYRNNSSSARENWKQQTDTPRNPVELTMAAALAAEAGSDDALAYIDQIRSYEPAEADAVLA